MSVADSDQENDTGQGRLKAELSAEFFTTFFQNLGNKQAIVNKEIKTKKDVEVDEFSKNKGLYMFSMKYLGNQSDSPIYCPIYVGKTITSFTERFKEHWYSSGPSPSKSNFNTGFLKDHVMNGKFPINGNFKKNVMYISTFNTQSDAVASYVRSLLEEIWDFPCNLRLNGKTEIRETLETSPMRMIDDDMKLYKELDDKAKDQVEKISVAAYRTRLRGNSSADEIVKDVEKLKL